MSRMWAAVGAAVAGAILPVVLMYGIPYSYAVLAAHQAAAATIAFIPPITADDIWEPAHLGAMEAVRGSHKQIYWNGPTFADDVATQIQLLQQAVAKKARGIILVPVYSSALLVPVEQALRQGADIVVVGEALPLPITIRLHYVLSDEGIAGRLMAARLTKLLGTHGLVGVVGVDPESPASFGRVKAFETALGAVAPYIHIAACIHGAKSRLVAEQSTRALLREEPQIRAVVALTPESTAGAFAALQELPPDRRPALLGAGQEYSSLYRLSEGQIDSLLVDDTFQMGRISAELLRETTSSPSTSELLIPPVLVTRETMLQPALTPILTHLSGAGL